MDKCIYEKDYFKDYYPNNLENSTSKGIQKIKNWFFGWFNYLNKFINLENGNNRKVLEIGCAMGVFCSILKEHNFDVYAGDVSFYAIEHARKLWPGIKFYRFDIQEGIPINEQFDIIFSFEVLEHLENPEKALRNIYDKLSPNGILICSTPPPYKRFLEIKGHINVKSKQEWQEILEKVGFQKDNIKVKQVGFMPFLYRYSKKLSLVMPIKVNLPYFISTYFLLVKK